MNEQPQDDKESHPLWIWVGAAFVAFCVLIGLLSGSREAFQMFSPAVALGGLVVVAILFSVALTLRKRLETRLGKKRFFEIATALLGLGGVFLGSFVYSFLHRPPPPQPSPVPTSAPTTAPLASPSPSQPPSASSPSRPPLRPKMPTRTPSTSPSPSPQPLPTPRIDWRAELLSGRPVIAQITRTPPGWGPQVEIIEGEKYRIQFNAETCEWRTDGTINHQQDGIVPNFTNRAGPRRTPFMSHSEGSTSTSGCFSPAGHQLMILHIPMLFDANGNILLNGRAGHLELEK